MAGLSSQLSSPLARHHYVDLARHPGLGRTGPAAAPFVARGHILRHDAPDLSDSGCWVVELGELRMLLAEVRCRASSTAGQRHEGPAKNQRMAHQPPPHRTRVTSAEDRHQGTTARPCLDSADHAGTESLRTRRWSKPDSVSWASITRLADGASRACQLRGRCGRHQH
jgi:hypothetical protein